MVTLSKGLTGIILRAAAAEAGRQVARGFAKRLGGSKRKRGLLATVLPNIDANDVLSNTLASTCLKICPGTPRVPTVITEIVRFHLQIAMLFLLP